jgi:hypothetical protein
MRAKKLNQVHRNHKSLQLALKINFVLLAQDSSKNLKNKSLKMLKKYNSKAITFF